MNLYRQEEEGEQLRKKIFSITILVFAGICILIPLVWFLYDFSHREEPVRQEDYGSFTTQTVVSYDGKLSAQCTPEKYNGRNKLTRQIRIDIKNTETKETVYSFFPARVWDFWGICWESDSYNLWIQSGDTGVHCYKYEEGEWIQDYDAVRPADIISKYD